jgi:hypothetical protein
MEMKNIAYLLLIFLFLPTVCMAYEQVEILAVEGVAQYRLGDLWQELASGAKIPQGAQIRTFDDSMVLVAIPGGHQVLLGSNVDLVLSNIASGDVKLYLSLGKVWSRVRKKLEGLLKFEIETPSAVAGVRGTQFSVEVLATGYTHVSVWEGRVWVGDRHQELELYERQTASADSLKGLSKPRPMDEQEQKEWEKFLDYFIQGKGQDKNPPGLEKKRINEKWKQWWEEHPQGRPWSEESFPFGFIKRNEKSHNFPEDKSNFEEKLPFAPPGLVKKRKELLADLPPKKKDTE